MTKEERVKQVRDFVEVNYEYYNITEMIEELKTDRRTILRCYEELGIKPKSKSELTLQSMVERPYMTIPELAKHLGYNEGYVIKLVEEHNLPNRMTHEEMLAENASNVKPAKYTDLPVDKVDTRGDDYWIDPVDGYDYRKDIELKKRIRKEDGKIMAELAGLISSI